MSLVGTQRSRLITLPWYVSIIFVTIIGRLFYLQVYSGYTLLRLSKKNCLRLEKVMPPRGNILDIHGNLIATNRPVLQLIWKGTGNRDWNDQQQKLLAALETLTPLDATKKEDLKRCEQRGTTLILYPEISFEQLSAILEQFPDHTNLHIKTSCIRFYPYTTTACHILGYLSGLTYEATGKMGLEKIFEETLKGTPGQLMNTINSQGRCLQQEEILQAMNGKDVETTLDIELNQLAEEVFPAESSGALLVVEAATGAIRVLLSRPHFDSNLFLQPITSEQWDQLQINRPFLNRATSGCYPPASLFKLVTLIAALEEGIVTPETFWHCPGWVEFAGRRYHCKRREGHGKISMEESLVQSCNAPFYEIGKRIKIDTLAHYAKLVGLGEPGTSLLPEKTGIVASSAWKRATLGKPWWPGETLSVTIGQSFSLVTPLQVALMLIAIVEGYRVKGRILAEEPIEQTPLPFKPQNLQFMRHAMSLVTHHGTGRRLSKLTAFKLYGKTGTAQVKGLDLGDDHDEHAWFAAHVQYKNEPAFVIVTMVEHAGSALVAVDVTHTFLKKYQVLRETKASQQTTPKS